MVNMLEGPTHVGYRDREPAVLVSGGHMSAALFVFLEGGEKCV